MTTRRIVVGPHAVERLAAAAEWLDRLPLDAEIVLVAPTWSAADDFARSAVARSGARFGLVRLTLDRLAARVAAPFLAAARRAPGSGLALGAVVARAIHLLLQEGRLGYFEPVARRPGFARAVARTLDELRMNRAPTGELARSGRGGPDLAAIAERVERELRDAGIADRAAVYAAAADGARAAPDLAGRPLLLLDVPLWTRLEADLVASLAAAAPEAIATTPSGDERSAAALQAALGCALERAAGSPPPSSLAALQAHLFEASAPPPSPLDDTVSFLSRPGEARECVEIARNVQTEAARGVPFDSIAVFLRSPVEYRPYLEEAFRRAAIPAYFAHGTTRPDPAGRALLALLRCAAEGLSARRFAEYLSLAQVPERDAADDPDRSWAAPAHDLLPAAVDVAPTEPAPAPLFDDPDAAPVVAGALHAPWRWEELLVEASVIGRKERWARRLDGLAAGLAARRRELGAEDEARLRRTEREIRDLGHLRDFALPLVEALAALPEGGSWGDWLRALRGLADRALREPAAVLAALGELEPMAPIGPVAIDEVELVLRERLSDLAVPPPRRRYGSVFVGPAEAARGMAFDVVFVPGLAERMFPRKVVEDPILLDEERSALGIRELTTDEGRRDVERLALRVSASAARRRLYLSYPRLDVEKARNRVASFYGLEAFRAAEGVLCDYRRLDHRGRAAGATRLAWPAPEDPRAAIDEAEYDLAVLSPLLRPGGEAATGAARYLVTANPHLARALRTRARRWLRRWTPADGLVEPDALARAALARHQMGARSFSPTALQNFAICPYRFFLQAIHRLEPRDEPVAIELLDPLTRGSLFHEAQFLILTGLGERGLLPVEPATLEAARDFADAALDAVAAEYAERLDPAIPRVWDDEIHRVRADLREWLRRQAEADDGWTPCRFELSFGIVDRDRANADPASVREPIALGKLRLRGAIDLVERHAGRGTLRATDHKTGKVRADAGVVVGGGKVLQPVLYALACERLLGEPVEAGRLYYCTADGDYTERVVPLDAASRAAVAAVIDVVDAALSAGFLPAAPERRTCEWCDYRPVCGPYEEIRTERKPRAALDDLARLRGMP